MIVYIAFLRAVNIGGKNKIAMEALKNGFKETGFFDVETYQNSGNVIFRSDRADIDHISDNIREMIFRIFHLSIAVTVYRAYDLKQALMCAPVWWGTDDNEIYDNLILMISPYTTEMYCEKIGAPKEGLEQAEIYGNTIFWSFRRKENSKTNWWPRTAMEGIGEMITIRTAGTIRRLIAKSGV